MGSLNHSIDYAQELATLVKQLPEDRAAQLYDFARFLLIESRRIPDDGDRDDAADISADELAAEDATWEAALTHHADTFAELKAQALADIAAGKTVPMFNERGDFSIE
jgi:hypothetical protein